MEGGKASDINHYIQKEKGRGRMSISISNSTAFLRYRNCIVFLCLTTCVFVVLRRSWNSLFLTTPSSFGLSWLGGIKKGEQDDRGLGVFVQMFGSTKLIIKKVIVPRSF